MPFDRIIYFGDSLTDSGAFFNLSSQLLALPLPSTLFGYAGQFSNGAVYADIAPTILGIGSDESLNYAVGGAEAVGSFNMGGFLASSPLALPNPDPALLNFDSNLGGQVARFLEDRPALGDLSSAAASFFIGLNDFNGLARGLDPATFDPLAFGAQAQQLAADIITATLGAATQAALAGVGTIIINTLPVGGFFPLTQAVPEFAQPLANDLVRQFNDALIASSAGLQQLGVEVVIVDFETLADEIMANGTSYGFLNTTDALLSGTGANPELIDPDGEGPLPPQPGFEVNPELAALDPDQFAFYDLLHPTTATHGLFGAFQAATLAGENIGFLGDGRNFDRGTADDDLTFGQGGRDFVFGGAGDDALFGGNDRDNLRGGADNNIDT
ncbi:MAG: SGNH/GDSL hydrolase family protein [Paracoccaceae bacterium]